MTEESPLNPQTAYGICKTLVERDVQAMAKARFAPIFLRNANAYGTSPRMRFDIVLNNLAGLAWTTREIRMTSDGTPWRPIVHGLDICQAIAAVLEAPREAIANEGSVGDTRTTTVKEIAQTSEKCSRLRCFLRTSSRTSQVSFERFVSIFRTACR